MALSCKSLLFTALAMSMSVLRCGRSAPAARPPPRAGERAEGSPRRWGKACAQLDLLLAHAQRRLRRKRIACDVADEPGACRCSGSAPPETESRCHPRPGTGGRDHHGVTVMLFNVFRVVHHGVRHAVDDGRKGIVQKADRVFVHGHTSDKISAVSISFFPPEWYTVCEFSREEPIAMRTRNAPSPPPSTAVRSSTCCAASLASPPRCSKRSNGVRARSCSTAQAPM